MGYYTDYELEIEGGKEGIADFEQWILDNQECSDPEENYLMSNILLSLVEERYYNGKWYNYDVDMKRISAKFPRLRFILFGCGEDRNDNWISCFFGGEHLVRVESLQPIYKFGEQELNREQVLEALKKPMIVL